jgi:hypothetical protein
MGGHPLKRILLRIIYKKSLGPGRILWYDINSRKMDMRFGTWSVRSQHRTGSLTVAVRELAEI